MCLTKSWCAYPHTLGRQPPDHILKQDLEPEIDERIWSRFRWYAGLVREMRASCVYPHQLGVHRNSWIVLASRLRGEPLFPSIRRLQIPADVEDIEPLLFSLSPTVRSFILEFEIGVKVTAQDKDFLHPFLTLISDPSGYPLPPSMYELINLEGDGGTEEVVQHLRKCTRLSMLEELDLSKIMYSIDHSSLTALSRLPSLHTLNAGLLVRDPAIPPAFTFSGFASLRNLSLRHQPLPTLSKILATSDPHTSPLRSLDLECGACIAADNPIFLPISEFQHHLALIGTALPVAFLSLRLSFTYNARTEPPLPLSALFAPFLSLPNMKSFDVSFCRGYVPHVADADLRALAGAWPGLEVLRVWVWEMRAPAFSSACPPTIAGLVELATGCPRLRRVTLPALDVSTLPAMSTLPSEGHEGVRFLDVCALVNDEGVALEDVASILYVLFPCLEECSRRGAGTPQAKSWHEVQDAMRKMQVARRGVRRE